MTDQPTLNMCAVGGCASVGTPVLELPLVLISTRLSEQEFDIEISLCDYHLGWYEAYAGAVNASLVAA